MRGPCLRTFPAVGKHVEPHLSAVGRVCIVSKIAEVGGQMTLAASFVGPRFDELRFLQAGKI